MKESHYTAQQNGGIGSHDLHIVKWAEEREGGKGE